jgi:hypothetical protein
MKTDRKLTRHGGLYISGRTMKRMGKKKMSVISLVSLAGLGVMLSVSLARTVSWGWTGAASRTPMLLESAPAREPMTVRAAGRGNPWINLKDGQELATVYSGGVGLEQMMTQKLTAPTALASADFDEDGVPDLVSGYVSPCGGIVTLHRGNLFSIYPSHPLGAEEQGSGGESGSSAPRLPRPSAPLPFLPEARVFEVEAAPDFLGAGDFDADGHWDVVAAARGSDRLSLLAGDGRGGFGAAKQIRLPGSVTALIVGEINRRDGLTDVVVGIVGADGPEVLVFEGPNGALSVGAPSAAADGRPPVVAGDLNAGGHRGPPRQVSVRQWETIALPAEATAARCRRPVVKRSPSWSRASSLGKCSLADETFDEQLRSPPSVARRTVGFTMAQIELSSTFNQRCSVGS